MSKIDDATEGEIARMLTAPGREVSPETVSAIRQFIANVGGVKNAQRALEMLDQLREAA